VGYDSTSTKTRIETLGVSVSRVPKFTL